MRNLLLVLAAIGILASTVGCANGPIRQWLRGAPCDTCNPQFSHSAGENLFGAGGGCADGTCSTGTCGSGLCGTGAATAPTGNGLLGGVFRNNNRPIFNNPAATAPPASIPATALGQESSFGGFGGGTPEIYGSTTSAGRIELPPTGPFN